MPSFPTSPPHSPPGRLHGAASAYLQQHAGNPVDWHPWGEEAFEAARAQNKPIFLSIGYSTCYWCHVMEQDVFDNRAIADKMNAWFVNIKVDREERPEVDEIYMSARQLITHQGGWPNNVFLTPDLKPFYAVGTMASDGRYGQIPFPDLLEKIHQTWSAEQEKVIQTAEETARAIETLMARAESGSAQALEPGIPGALFEFMETYYDETCGGFFQEPKFPHETYLLFLLDYHRRKGAEKALEMTRHSLLSMAAGGIHDHVGGGFHRYAVDRAWRTPHFEKMLYNQALMAKCYAEFYRASNADYYREVAERTLAYVAESMTDAAGGFHAALDAETGGVEGAYYAWEEDELKSALSWEDFALLSKFYDLEEIPVFPGHHQVKGRVLFAREQLARLADKGGKDYRRQQEALSVPLETLLARRVRRESPHMDTKIVTGWNGLMIDAFATAGQIFASGGHIRRAENAARFLLENARIDGGDLSRMWSGGKAFHRAYLEDYSFLIAGLLSLHRATGSQEWSAQAVSLLDKADNLFLDAERGTYFFTDGRDRMISRIRKGSDSALPSCSGVMVSNFLDLHAITGEKAWLDRARNKLLAYAGAIKEHPAEYVSMAQALLRMEEEGLLS